MFELLSFSFVRVSLLTVRVDKCHPCMEIRIPVAFAWISRPTRKSTTIGFVHNQTKQLNVYCGASRTLHLHFFRSPVFVLNKSRWRRAGRHRPLKCVTKFVREYFAHCVRTRTFTDTGVEYVRWSKNDLFVGGRESNWTNGRSPCDVYCVPRAIRFVCTIKKPETLQSNETTPCGKHITRAMLFAPRELLGSSPFSALVSRSALSRARARRTTLTISSWEI